MGGHQYESLILKQRVLIMSYMYVCKISNMHVLTNGVVFRLKPSEMTNTFLTQ